MITSVRLRTLSVLIVSLLFSCAATIHHSWVPFPDSWEGVMVRSDEEVSKSMLECEPVDGVNKCVLLFVHEWKAVLKKIDALEKQVDDCQRGGG